MAGYMLKGMGFEIKCKQCGALMDIFEEEDYYNADNNHPIEVFPNLFKGVTICCDKCVDNGYEDCNVISVSEPTVI